MTTTSFVGLTVQYLMNSKFNSVTVEVMELSEQHTSEYLSRCLFSLCQDCQINLNKITAVVTANSANIFKSATQTFGESKHLPCFEHTIILVTSKIIEECTIKAVIDEIKNIVTYFKHNVAASIKNEPRGDPSKLKSPYKMEFMFLHDLTFLAFSRDYNPYFIKKTQSLHPCFLLKNSKFDRNCTYMKTVEKSC